MWHVFQFNSELRWALDSRDSKLSDYWILAVKVPTMYSRTLFNKVFHFKLCFANVAYFVSVISASYIPLDSGQPPISLLILPKSACVSHFSVSSCHWMQVAGSIRLKSLSFKLTHEIQFIQHVLFVSHWCHLHYPCCLCFDVQTVHTLFSFNSLITKKVDSG